MSRHVRVTLEGVTAQSDGVLRIRVGAPAPSPAFPLVLIDSQWPGVTVEDVTPARVWTDDDVAQALSGLAWQRIDGQWRPANGGGARKTDAGIDALLERGSLTVLRYQHGEQ